MEVGPTSMIRDNIRLHKLELNNYVVCSYMQSDRINARFESFLHYCLVGSLEKRENLIRHAVWKNVLSHERDKKSMLVLP